MKKHSKISFKEREQILILVNKEFSQRQIAKELGRNQSNISRELQRCGMNRNTYSIAEAQIDRNQKASFKGRKRKLLKERKLLKFLREKIIQFGWSPEQVSGYLRKNKRYTQISHETIYSYIYSIEDKEERDLWIKALRRKKKKRASRKKGIEKRGKIPDRTSIHERPKIVDKRKEGGHWEGDLIIGKKLISAIGTAVERVSRFTIIIGLPNQKTSDIVVNAFSDEFCNIPSNMRKSMTYDNGSEMTLHKSLTQKRGMRVYFADPGSPGQRGTNENTNGLIREFFPKGTDFKKISAEELKRIQTLLNQRPRKILGYATPEEVFKKMIKKEPIMNEYQRNADLVQ